MYNLNLNVMAKSSPRPFNGPSTTGNKSGGNRGNNPPRSTPKPASPKSK
jgi:hypothetical protein